MTSKRAGGARAAVFGTYGFGNMGDAAVADITIAGLRRHLADAEVVGICQQPENARIHHGIEAFSIFRNYVRHREEADAPPSLSPVATPVSSPAVNQAVAPVTGLKPRLKAFIKSIPVVSNLMRWLRDARNDGAMALREIGYSRDMWRILRTLDLVVIAGSGQLNEDWGGPWRYPFALFRWCLLARLAGCKVAFLSIGAGNVTSFWGRRFCAWALRLAHYRSVRDSETLQQVRSWGVKDVHIVPDMAFSLRFNASAEREPGQTIVGINPIAYCDPRSWHEADPARYRAYVDKMSGFCAWLLRRGHVLQFVPNERRMDNPVIDDILAGLPAELRGSGQIRRPPIASAHDVGNALAICDYVIASRFHGLLFSYLSYRPAITIAFHFKFNRLADEMGQQKFCLDIATFRIEELQSMFGELVREHAAIGAEIARRVAPYPAAIERQFEAMRALIR